MVRRHKKAHNCLKQDFPGLSLNWAENVHISDVSFEHCLSAYELNFPKHGAACKKNCSKNPFCLSGLIRDENSNGNGLEEGEVIHNVREGNNLVGLRNLGATCYMNSLLQLLFSNVSFRNIILSLDVSGVINSCGDSKLLSPNPAAVICNLQYLFAAMLYGNKAVVDPSDFVNSLNLEPRTQQDAHEFLQLLLDIFDTHLAKQDNPSTRDLIKQTFQGEYTYVTTCSVCEKPSACLSTFYELDLKMSASLYDSLREFIKHEDLSGSDRYRCSNCQELREATRCIELNALPPVLIIQIMRFFYDRNTGVKKKLKTTIRFPEKLDMRPFIRSGSWDYDLAGMLIHQGPSAYSGHYIAHVFDESSGEWVNINDGVSEKVGLRKMHRMYSCNLKKDAPFEKGMLYSNNVYMLMYVDKGTYTNIPIAKEQLQPYILDRLNHLNDSMNEQVKAAQSILAVGQNDSESRKKELLQVFGNMSVTESYDAISLKWLTHWTMATLKGTVVKPIENKPILCMHGKLSLKFTTYKYISSDVATSLYEQFGGGPRLTAPVVFCLECIRVKVLDIKFRSRVNRVHKEFIVGEKYQDPTSEVKYWIGKKTWKLWKKLALALNPYSLDNPENGDASEEITEDGKSEDSSKVGNHNSENDQPTATKSENSSENDLKSEKIVCDENNANSPGEHNFSFNDDLLCAHGFLAPGEDNKRSVNESAWSELSSFFQDVPQFRTDAEECPCCLEEERKDNLALEERKNQSKAEKATLPDLASGKRIKYFKNGQCFLLHNETFVFPWRLFLRDWRQGYPRPSSLFTIALLCPHDLLMFDPSDKEDLKHITLINEESWAALCSFYTTPYEPTVPVIITFEGGIVIETRPSLCQECTLSRRQALRQQPVDFVNAVIFIRRLANTSEIEPSLLMVDDEADPNVRRSRRKRGRPGDTSINVRNTDTLATLRSKIYDKLHVLPYAQKLMLEDGTVLTEDLPLKNLNIRPYTVIYLQCVYEEEGDLDMFAYNDAQPEFGFQGMGI